MQETKHNNISVIDHKFIKEDKAVMITYGLRLIKKIDTNLPFEKWKESQRLTWNYFYHYLRHISIEELIDIERAIDPELLCIAAEHTPHNSWIENIIEGIVNVLLENPELIQDIMYGIRSGRGKLLPGECTKSQ